MSARLRPTHLPETIPVFPLAGVLLLPRGKLPLNIFEPRYVAMTEAALATPERLVGMIQPVGEGDGGAPTLYPVGCAGRIVSFSESDDARYRYLITLLGVCRFTIAEEVEGQGGFRRVRADWDAIAEAPDDRLITTLSMVCPFSAPEKQALLEAEDAAARARAVMALMEMAARGGDEADRPAH